MKVHAYLLCYNEEQIISSILKYYSEFCSKIFLLDNFSTDRSVEIAQTFNCVEIIQWNSNGVLNDKLNVSMKTETYKNHSRKDGKYTTEIADWVIAADMDEVLYHPNLMEVLADYKKQGVTVPMITGFNMVGEDEIDPDQPITKQYHYGSRAPVFDKRILFSPDFDMSYSLGAHPSGPGFEYMKTRYGYISSNKHPIGLLHFKHVGSRFLKSAEKNAPRIPDGLIKKVNGKYSGPGHHYQKALDAVSDGTYKKFTSNIRIVDENGDIDFLKFNEPRDNIHNIEQNNTSFNKSIDAIRDLAVAIENVETQLAYELMLIARKNRPNGGFIKNKLKEYEAKLKKTPTSA